MYMFVAEMGVAKLNSQSCSQTELLQVQDDQKIGVAEMGVAKLNSQSHS